MLASLAGRPADARELHRRGLDLARRLESPLWIAHCLWDYASYILPDDQLGAKRMMTEAALICDEHNLVGLAQRMEGH
jgi:hypothetical protein